MKESIYISAVLYFSTVVKLESILKDTYTALDKNFIEFEIIVVNDTSRIIPDSIINTLPNPLKNSVIIINLGFKHGFERAIHAGTDLCKGDFIYEINGDNFAYSYDIFYRMYKDAMSKNCDIVFCTNNKDSFINRMIKKRLHNADIRVSKITLSSRRALNNLLMLKSKIDNRTISYMKTGFNYLFIYEPSKSNISNQYKNLLYLFINSNVPNRLIGMIFLFYIVFSFITVYNILLDNSIDLRYLFSISILIGLNILILFSLIGIRYLMMILNQLKNENVYTVKSIKRL